MDSLTHLVLGAAVGEVLAGKKIGRKAMFWGALVNTIPDLDVLGGLFLSDAHQIMFHRGITHSFLFVGIASFVLSCFFHLLWQGKKNWGLLDSFLFFFIGLLSHDLLDSLTGYGTGWFEPFNHSRVSFNSIFVADPFYTLPFLCCILLALFAGVNHKRRRRLTHFGLLISTIYLFITLINHYFVYHVAEKSLLKKHFSFDHLIVTPTPLNNFLWMAYTHDSLGSRIGYYSLLDKSPNIEFRRKYRNDSLLTPFNQMRDVKILKLLSNGNYLITKEGKDIYFNDLRFGEMSGWDLSDTNFVFKFNVSTLDSNGYALNRMKYNVSYSNVLYSLTKRIMGK